MANKKFCVMIVEDDEVALGLVEQILDSEGYAVQKAKTVFQAKGVLERTQPDLLILDRQLPDKDGLEFCKEIRCMEQFKNLPILFLTAKKSTTDKVVGLKMGGDDYLTKPFKSEELLARIEALLRRAHPMEPEPSHLNVGDLEINLEARKVYLKKRELPLWPKEFDLLLVFAQRKNRVLTREFLMEHVWGYEKQIQLTTKVVDVTVGHLRSKLGSFGKNISSVKGYGYRLDLP
ncbi:MAG: response regulator transcription factor [Elusimicrobia bacterium]|nr:response regulator transcription factor [Elusimicrobiota bacterium]